MYRHFETELKDLKEQLLAMGGHVELAIAVATQAFQQKNPELLKQVHQLETKINEEHKQVDQACIELLARQSPLAADLRLIIATLKINTDLERMGDQAVNIAYNTTEYLSGPSIPIANDIPKMAQEVRDMVRNALDAFVKQDPKLAQAVLDKDDIVDDLKDKIFHELVAYMAKHSDSIEHSINLILIARNLERLGDHATNIAEDVIYVVSGEDVRHTAYTREGQEKKV